MSLAPESMRAVGGEHTAVAEPVVRLELPATLRCHAIGRLVAGGFASRLAFPIEQMEDLQLAVEAVLSRRPARRVITLELTPSDTGLRARLGPFAPAPAERQRVRTMLGAFVEAADVQDAGDGEWIVLNAARFRAPAREST